MSSTHPFYVAPQLRRLGKIGRVVVPVEEHHTAEFLHQPTKKPSPLHSAGKFIGQQGKDRPFDLSKFVQRAAEGARMANGPYRKESTSQDFPFLVLDEEKGEAFEGTIHFTLMNSLEFPSFLDKALGERKADPNAQATVVDTMMMAPRTLPYFVKNVSYVGAALLVQGVGLRLVAYPAPDGQTPLVGQKLPHSIPFLKNLPTLLISGISRQVFHESVDSFKKFGADSLLLIGQANVANMTLPKNTTIVDLVGGGYPGTEVVSIFDYEFDRTYDMMVCLMTPIPLLPLLNKVIPFLKPGGKLVFMGTTYQRDFFFENEYSITHFVQEGSTEAFVSKSTPKHSYVRSIEPLIGPNRCQKLVAEALRIASYYIPAGYALPVLKTLSVQVFTRTTLADDLPFDDVVPFLRTKVSADEDGTIVRNLFGELGELLTQVMFNRRKFQSELRQVSIHEFFGNKSCAKGSIVAYPFSTTKKVGMKRIFPGNMYAALQYQGKMEVPFFCKECNQIFVRETKHVPEKCRKCTLGGEGEEYSLKTLNDSLVEVVSQIALTK